MTEHTVDVTVDYPDPETGWKSAYECVSEDTWERLTSVIEVVERFDVGADSAVGRRVRRPPEPAIHVDGSRTSASLMGGRVR